MNLMYFRRRTLATRLLVASMATLMVPLEWAGLPSLELGAPSAFAAAPSRDKKVALFVLSSSGQNDIAATLGEAMRDMVDNLEGVRAVGPNGDDLVTLKQKAGPNVETGYRSLNDKDSASALKSFERAQQALEGYRGRLDRRLAARITKGLGVARVMEGDVAEGQESINTSLNLWSDQQGGEYAWTLDSRGAFREVVRSRDEGGVGALEVTTEPEGAAIRVNGEFKGFAAPGLEIPGLTPGKHWVEASTDGYTRSGMFVDVLPGQSGIQHFDLEAVPSSSAVASNLKKLKRTIGGTGAKKQLSALQRMTVADTVVALDVSQRDGGFFFQGWRHSASGSERIAKQVAQDDQFFNSLQGFMSEVLGAEPSPPMDELVLDAPPAANVFGADTGDDLFIDPNDPIFADGGEKGGDSITSEWWFWAVVGGVTAGLVAGGVVLFSDSGEGSGPTGNVVVNLNALQ